MIDIIDNRQELLAGHVCKILRQADSVKFAVGYFFVSGLQEIRQQLTHISAIRLLIGNQSNQETIDALMQREMHPARVQSVIGKLQSPKEKKRVVEETGKGIREALSIPPLTDEAEELLTEIKEWLASGKLEVRVYMKEKLHAKAYLFAYPEQTYEHGIGIVGSSNLTLSGLRNNTELNVLVHGNNNFNQLNIWFDRLWEEGEPFNTGLMQEIEQSC
jgi:HKD family nuclease